jgi:cytosine deaminase
MDLFIQEAIAEARKGLSEGGIPIGTVLVRNNIIIGRGHNRRVQELNPMKHGEIDCLINAGRVGSYRDTVLYSTLMPCYLCAGAVVQFNIPKVVVGEARTFQGAETFMRDHGVEVITLDLKECVEMMEQFIRQRPELWNEDIGK